MKLNAKTKRILLAIVAIVAVVVVAVIWFKRMGAEKQEDNPTQGGLIEVTTDAETTGDWADAETSDRADTETTGAATDEVVTTAEETTAEATEPETEAPTTPSETESAGVTVKKGKSYSDKEHVAAYINEFGELPPNYITKSAAEDLGWSSSKGNLWKAANGKSIGGDRFGNYEGQLPKKKGRQYYECDIDYQGGYRNEKRIIFSNDGLVYYTADHYKTFELLYGEE